MARRSRRSHVIEGTLADLDVWRGVAIVSSRTARVARRGRRPPRRSIWDTRAPGVPHRGRHRRATFYAVRGVRRRRAPRERRRRHRRSAAASRSSTRPAIDASRRASSRVGGAARRSRDEREVVVTVRGPTLVWDEAAPSRCSTCTRGEGRAHIESSICESCVSKGERESSDERRAWTRLAISIERDDSDGSTGRDAPAFRSATGSAPPPRRRSAPVVSYFTWFRVGSRHEKPGKTGLAHLFEHLMFNETEGAQGRRVRSQARRERRRVERRDLARLDLLLRVAPEGPLRPRRASSRASAWRTSSCASRRSRARKRSSPTSAAMRVDDDVEGHRERAPLQDRVHQAPVPLADHRLDGRHPGFTPDDCVRFYKTYYAPNNATDRRRAATCARETCSREVRDAYGAIPRRRSPPRTRRPSRRSSKSAPSSSKKPTATEKLCVGYHGPALGDADHAALTVLNEVLFGGRASRMHRELVIDEGDCTARCAAGCRPSAIPGSTRCTSPRATGTTATSSSRALDARARNACATTSSTDDELERAKARLELGALAVARDARAARPSRSASTRRCSAIRRPRSGGSTRIGA